MKLVIALLPLVDLLLSVEDVHFDYFVLVLHLFEHSIDFILLLLYQPVTIFY